jgi:predicted dienelactone hydrolase
VKRLLKWLGVFLLAVCLVACGVVVVLVSQALRPVHPVGMQQVLAPDPGHPPIVVTIFYPATGEPRLILMGVAVARLAPDAQITGGLHPLVVISHGTGGGTISHIDTALALADAGYVVAVPLHNGDNYQDTSEVGTDAWFVDRARQIVRTDDFLFGSWKDRAHVDPKRTGLFGFSAGGTTALVVIGGTPDFSRVDALCRTHAEFVCGLRKPGIARVPAADAWTHDPRIGAAVVVAPGYGFTFEPAGLASVHVPVQLWEGSADASLPLATNALAVQRLLPQPPEFHLVAGADHFSFLAPCGAAKIALPRLLCVDPQGFDRTAFHRQFNAALIAFFDRTLPVR